MIFFLFKFYSKVKIFRDPLYHFIVKNLKSSNIRLFVINLVSFSILLQLKDISRSNFLLKCWKIRKAPKFELWFFLSKFYSKGKIFWNPLLLFNYYKNMKSTNIWPLTSIFNGLKFLYFIKKFGIYYIS